MRLLLVVIRSTAYLEVSRKNTTATEINGKYMKEKLSTASHYLANKLFLPQCIVVALDIYI